MPLTSSHWGAFSAEWDGEKVTPAKAYPSDPDPTPIISGIPELYASPTRIRRPAVRKSWLEGGPGAARGKRGAEPFVEISWDEALDLVASELKRVKRDHGNEAIFGGSYGWASAGRFHHAQGQLKRFLNLFGGFVDQVNNYSYGAGMVLLPHILGNNDLLLGRCTSWRSIIENTELFVAFGGIPPKNAQIESGGFAEHNLARFSKDAAARGMRTINISPVRADTLEAMNAQWWPARPGTDCAILLALAHTLISQDLHDKAFLERHATGFDRFADYVTNGRPGGFDAQWASEISGLPAQDIVSLAREMASRRTMLSLSWSIQRADHGEQPYWAAVALAAMLGQIGLPGGGLGFGYGATNGVGSVAPKWKAPSMPTGRNPTGAYIPVARVADLLLEPGKPIPYNGREIVLPEQRIVYWAGGNPFHHHQDINRLVRAWRKPETVIVHEISWTATARFADIVLPVTTTLERNDLGASSAARHVIAMRSVAPKHCEARNDHDIFADLAGRLGFRQEFTEGRGEMEWIRHLYDSARQANAAIGVELPAFERFWQEGIHELPELDPPYVAYADFRRDPGAHPLNTPSGRIEIFSETIASFGLTDCPGHPKWIEPREWLGAELAQKFPLHLISNQPKTRLHSQLDAVGESRRSKVGGRECITMHPGDAAARGLAEGDPVRVFNDRGACLAAVTISDAVMPGVVQLPTGAWYDPADPAEPGSLDVHGNPNVLTHDLGTSSLTGGASAQTVLVEVERFAGPPPEVQARKAPSFA